jgi:dethiobiotin synthetase
MKGLFVTGTDTGIGKTYVACGIAAAWRTRGLDVGVMKPAETGCRARNGVLVPADAQKLLRASRAGDPIDLVNPYRFRLPLAPAVAAAQEGAPIRIAAILKAYRQLRKRHSRMLVEGAGGIMVPLTRRGAPGSDRGTTGSGHHQSYAAHRYGTPYEKPSHRRNRIEQQHGIARRCS